MQDGPLILREDVTVSLDKELIEKIVGIAEIRGTTLSTLVRDILGAFCRAYSSGSDWTRSEDLAIGTTGIQPDTRTIESGQDQIVRLLSRISTHDELIAALEARISLLEIADGAPRPRIQTPTQITFSPAALNSSLPPGQSMIAEVIDSEAPLPGEISDEALVKIRRPVSPVITSVDVNSIGRINPDQDYSNTEAAALLNISSTTIRKYVKEGRLNSRKVGRTTIFKGKDLLMYLERMH